MNPQGKVENQTNIKFIFKLCFFREDEGTDYESVRSLG